MEQLSVTLAMEVAWKKSNHDPDPALVRRQLSTDLRAVEVPAAVTDVRARLRLITASAHERIAPPHSGFAAAAAGTISLSDYRLLLSRLFGFHKAFEIVQTRGRYLSRRGFI